MTKPTAISDLQLVERRLEELIPYAHNPRKNDHAVDRMCGSIREFGFKVPILATSSGAVVDGHLRLKAAQKLKLEGTARRTRTNDHWKSEHPQMDHQRPCHF